MRRALILLIIGVATVVGVMYITQVGPSDPILGIAAGIATVVLVLFGVKQFSALK